MEGLVGHAENGSFILSEVGALRQWRVEGGWVLTQVFGRPWAGDGEWTRGWKSAGGKLGNQGGGYHDGPRREVMGAWPGG